GARAALECERCSRRIVDRSVGVEVGDVAGLGTGRAAGHKYIEGAGEVGPDVDPADVGESRGRLVGGGGSREGPGDPEGRRERQRHVKGGGEAILERLDAKRAPAATCRADRPARGTGAKAGKPTVYPTGL